MKNYLAAIGIESWKLCWPMPGAKANHNLEVRQLVTENGQNFGYLLLDNHLVDNSLEKKINRLLTAMLTTIGLRISERTVGSAISLVNEKIIMMGKCPEPFPNNATVVVTLHPQDILQQPLLKKQVWWDLQTLL